MRDLNKVIVMANYAMRKHSFGEFVTKLKLCYNYPNYNIAKLFSLTSPLPWHEDRVESSGLTEK